MKGLRQPGRTVRKPRRSAAALDHGRDGLQSDSAPATTFRHPKSELEAAARRYVDLYDFAPVPFISFNAVGRIEEINLAAAALLGMSRAALLRNPFTLCVVKADIRQFLHHLFRCRSHHKRVQTEMRLKGKDDEVIPVQLASMPTSSSVENGALLYQTVIVDLRERREVEAVLRDAQALLETRVAERTAALLAANKDLENEIALRKRLEGEILEISDREQRRLGQELHDSLCQHLTAVAFMARALAERLKSTKKVEAAEIEKIAELINDGVSEARTVARGLHPVQMDSGGLMVALRAMASQRWSVPVHLKINEEILVRDPTVSLHLYRIAREAVINASKHAGAREIIVRMRGLTNGMELSVTDDGIGIPDDRRNSQGMGLHIMDYRARSIGARLEIKAVKPRGTRVVCLLPRK